ncbi:hypothetical protein GE09DRAFT_992736 [Coniochaeta sp. 2T2.1]|nr:hypothetical protein GE09DRAFT_992736 [Coniochaeta sp. 2T2.1]
MTRLALTCPYGGNFYVCEHNTTEFVGCCTTDPGHDGQGICPKDHLRNASFSPRDFADIMPQDCGDVPSLWYTCNFTSPPFLGCCKTNPCDAPCAPADLTPAKLSRHAKARSAFTTAPSTGVNITQPLTTSPESSRGLPSAASPSPTPDSFVLSPPTVAGFSIAVVAVVALVAVCMYIWGRRSGKRARARPEPPKTDHNPSRVAPAPAQQADLLHLDVPKVLVPGYHSNGMLPGRAHNTHHESPVTVPTVPLHHPPSS